MATRKNEFDVLLGTFSRAVAQMDLPQDFRAEVSAVIARLSRLSDATPDRHLYYVVDNKCPVCGQSWPLGSR